MKLLQELFAQGILSDDKMEDLEKQVQKTGKTEEDIILEKKDTIKEVKSYVHFHGAPFKGNVLMVASSPPILITPPVYNGRVVLAVRVIG